MSLPASAGDACEGRTKKAHLSRTARVAADADRGTLSADAAERAGRPGMWTSVPAVAKTVGVSVPNTLSPALAGRVVAQGSMRLDGAAGEHPYYGYLGDGPMVPPLGSAAEASKREPDKNTYLVLKDAKGADAAYDYDPDQSSCPLRDPAQREDVQQGRSALDIVAPIPVRGWGQRRLANKEERSKCPDTVTTARVVASPSRGVLISRSFLLSARGLLLGHRGRQHPRW